MVKIILLTGIEALNLYLCIYLAYNLIAERADSKKMKWRKRGKKHAENERIRWRFENRISGD